MLTLRLVNARHFNDNFRLRWHSGLWTAIANSYGRRGSRSSRLHRSRTGLGRLRTPRQPRPPPRPPRLRQRPPHRRLRLLLADGHQPPHHPPPHQNRTPRQPRPPPLGHPRRTHRTPPSGLSATSMNASCTDRDCAGALCTWRPPADAELTTMRVSRRRSIFRENGVQSPANQLNEQRWVLYNMVTATRTH